MVFMLRSSLVCIAYTNGLRVKCFSYLHAHLKRKGKELGAEMHKIQYLCWKLKKRRYTVANDYRRHKQPTQWELIMVQEIEGWSSH